MARALQEIAGVDCCSKSGMGRCLGMTGNAVTLMLCARVCPTFHAQEGSDKTPRSRCVGPGRSTSGGRPNDGGLCVVFSSWRCRSIPHSSLLWKSVLCSHCTSENLNVLMIAHTILCSRCCTLFCPLLIVENCLFCGLMVHSCFGCFCRAPGTKCLELHFTHWGCTA